MILPLLLRVEVKRFGSTCLDLLLAVKLTFCSVGDRIIFFIFNYLLPTAPWCLQASRWRLVSLLISFILAELLGDLSTLFEVVLWPIRRSMFWFTVPFAFVCKVALVSATWDPLLVSGLFNLLMTLLRWPLLFLSYYSIAFWASACSITMKPWSLLECDIIYFLDFALKFV